LRISVLFCHAAGKMLAQFSDQDMALDVSHSDLVRDTYIL